MNNLEDIQGYIKSLVDNQADLKAAGVVSILNDGTYPKIPARESALQSPGLCITIWLTDNAGIIDQAKTGVVNLLLYTAVVIEENTTVNRATGGTQLTAEHAFRLVCKALLGKSATGDPVNTQIQLHHEPFVNLGTNNGVWSIIGNFTKQYRLNPAL